MNRKKDRLRAILILVVAIALLAGGAFFYMKQREFLVGVDLCPLHQEISGHTIFVIDRTDVLSEELNEAMFDKIYLEASRIELFERFTLYALDREQTAYPRLLFSKCNPGNRSASDITFQTPERLQERYEAEFLGPLVDLVRDLDPANETPETPLLSFFAAVPSLGGFGEALPKRRLVVFSDMVQNARRYSHIRPDNGGFTESDYLDAGIVFDRLYPGGGEPSYKGIQVLIYQYQPRDQLSSERDSERHRRFWRGIFKEFGASSFEMQLL